MEEEYEDNPANAIIIMLMRNYDMLTVIAEALDPEKAAMIQRDHMAGKIYSPLPSYLGVKNDSV